MRIELADGVGSLEPDAWNALVGDGSPFLEWAWLASLEEAGCVRPETGWDARHGRCDSRLANRRRDGHAGRALEHRADREIVDRLPAPVIDLLV